jgi:ABC-type multidrug transport system ATPase subunit
MLRLPSTMTTAQKYEKVEKIMLLLNLKKCEYTLIGDPSASLKGVSGGEKRRLAFASEVNFNFNFNSICESIKRF